MVLLQKGDHATQELGRVIKVFGNRYILKTSSRILPRILFTLDGGVCRLSSRQQTCLRRVDTLFCFAVLEECDLRD